MCKHNNELEREKRESSKAAEKRKQLNDNWTPEQRQKHNERCRLYAHNNRDKVNAIMRRYRAKRKLRKSKELDSIKKGNKKEG